MSTKVRIPLYAALAAAPVALIFAGVRHDAPPSDLRDAVASEQLAEGAQADMGKLMVPRLAAVETAPMPDIQPTKSAGQACDMDVLLSAMGKTKDLTVANYNNLSSYFKTLSDDFYKQAMAIRALEGKTIIVAGGSSNPPLKASDAMRQNANLMEDNGRDFGRVSQEFIDRLSSCKARLAELEAAQAPKPPAQPKPSKPQGSR